MVGTASIWFVAPATGTPSLNHCSRTGGVPVNAAENNAAVPTVTFWFTGWTVKATGLQMTISSTLLLMEPPQLVASNR